MTQTRDNVFLIDFGTQNPYERILKLIEIYAIEKTPTGIDDDSYSVLKSINLSKKNTDSGVWIFR